MGNGHLLTTKTVFQRKMRFYGLLFVIAVFLLMVTNPQVVSALDSGTENIHAIIVSSSRYWFNYRHAINALGIYEIYRQNGIPDENIILSTFYG